jgi:hypothetical protein
MSEVIGRCKYCSIDVFIFKIDFENDIIELGYYLGSIRFERSIKDKDISYGK